MKGTIKKLVSLILSVFMLTGVAGSLAGCDGSTGPGKEPIDSSKVQIYVRNQQGGFGNVWLYNGKAKFEALHANDTYGDKTGVQIQITDKKEVPEATNIKNDAYDVYFVERVVYLNLQKQGLLADLTDYVVNKNTYEDKTILSKLTAEQQAFYGIEGTDGETHYYGLPHYVASQGFVYDMDLFDSRGYYFREGYEALADRPENVWKENIYDMFIENPGDKNKSAGPDGVKGTDDDGLPATYADFWILCEYIKQDGYMPLSWSGKSGADYSSALLAQLIADYQGKSEFMRNCTFEGDMEVVRFNGSSAVIDNGTPVTETYTLGSAANDGYESYRSPGYYYALQFIKDMVSHINEYTEAANIKSLSYTAFDAQDDYIISRHSSNVTRQAMLLEGTWWDSEATEAFSDMESVYKDAGKKENCRYGWLPLPKATREQVQKKVTPTLLNVLDSICFVKSGLEDWKTALCAEFVQFMNTDESLVDFTVQTNAFKNLSYEITPETRAKLSPFGRDMYKKYTSYDLINPNTQNAQYAATTSQTQLSRRFAIEVGTQKMYPYAVFEADSSMTVKRYFEQTYKYVQEAIWSQV